MTTARILESAERRFLGSIKHNDAAERLAANVERLRKAQVGRIKAKDYGDYPTNVSEETLRIRATWRKRRSAGNKCRSTRSSRCTRSC